KEVHSAPRWFARTRPGALRAAQGRVRAPLRYVDPERTRQDHRRDVPRLRRGASRRPGAGAGAAALECLPGRGAWRVLVVGVGALRVGALVPALRSPELTRSGRSSFQPRPHYRRKRMARLVASLEPGDDAPLIRERAVLADLPLSLDALERDLEARDRFQLGAHEFFGPIEAPASGIEPRYHVVEDCAQLPCIDR